MILHTRKKLAERFWKRVDLWFDITDEDCWNWTAGQDGRGYGCLSVRNKGKKATHVAFYLFHGRWPKGLLLHSCDNPLCINTSHLREGDDKDNTQDRVERERTAKGETSGLSKLTNEQVLLIKDKLNNTTLKHFEIAELFSVTRSTISSIYRGRTWKHIKR